VASPQVSNNILSVNTNLQLLTVSHSLAMVQTNELNNAEAIACDDMATALRKSLRTSRHANQLNAVTKPYLFWAALSPNDQKLNAQLTARMLMLILPPCRYCATVRSSSSTTCGCSSSGSVPPMIRGTPASQATALSSLHALLHSMRTPRWTQCTWFRATWTTCMCRCALVVCSADALPDSHVRSQPHRWHACSVADCEHTTTNAEPWWQQQARTPIPPTQWNHCGYR
jgi:hypothetical protein